MTQRLDQNSSDILRFRPVIDFVEPAQEPFPITPVQEDNPQPDNVDDRRREIQAFADALNLLAAAVQSRIDAKCKGMVIKLDPDVDAAVIAAMKRQFPDAVARSSLSTGGSGAGGGIVSPDTSALGKQDGFFITYDQYKFCRDKIRAYGCEVAAKVGPTNDDIAKAREDILAGNVNVGGFGTPEASNGGLRPELYGPGQVVKPLEMDKFQNELIKILVNYIWKHFIKPVLSAVLPFGAGNLLPDELVHVNNPLPDSIPTLK